MTDQSSARLSEFTWYSRLAAWIGAAMLLVQSVLGRDAGPVTVLAVLLLGLGFLCFLIGLAVDSRVPGTGLLMGALPADEDSQEASGKAPDTSIALQPKVDVPEPDVIAVTVSDSPKGEKPREYLDQPPDTPTVVAGSARRPKFRERAKKSDSRLERQSETVVEPVHPAERVPEPAAPVVEAVPVSVETEMLDPTSVSVGAECPRCGSSLRVGQLSASCPICGRTHHAICWMENHFHCEAPDCTGHGSLEAPATSHPAGEAPAE
jgi:hypothetical protein